MPSSIAHRRALPNGSGRDVYNRLRIVVLGYIVRGPIGGMAWHHLQYVLGLKQLGHEVLFLEDSDDYPSCYDPSTHEVGTDPSYGLQFAEHAFAKLGLANHWAYYDAHHARWHGPASGDVVHFCKDADVLLNVSGVNPLRGWHEPISLRVFIDTDPAFTQIRHLTNEAARSLASHHNAFFSFAGLIGTGESKIPDDGFPWQPTLQPIVIDAWPVTNGTLKAPFTTVMQWDSYPPTEFNGQRFGMKSESFDEVRSLPERVTRPLEIALGGVSAPRRDIERLGWRVADPLAVTRDPWTYQGYLQNSFGEFSIAKHGYVVSRSGWFSERTACYLASGRPAVVQDTGFSRLLPCSKGLLPFHDADSALGALQLVESDYRAHCRAARELATEYFDSRNVLRSLLDRAADIAAPSPRQSNGSD